MAGSLVPTGPVAGRELGDMGSHLGTRVAGAWCDCWVDPVAPDNTERAAGSGSPEAPRGRSRLQAAAGVGRRLQRETGSGSVRAAGAAEGLERLALFQTGVEGVDVFGTERERRAI